MASVRTTLAVRAACRTFWFAGRAVRIICAVRITASVAKATIGPGITALSRSRIAGIDCAGLAVIAVRITRAAAVHRTVFNRFLSLAYAVATYWCRATVYCAFVTIFFTLAYAVTATPAYCTVRAELLIIFFRMAYAITITLEAVSTASTSAT